MRWTQCLGRGIEAQYLCFVLALTSLALAQPGPSAWVGDDGPATSAVLSQAEGVAVDGDGNLYIADAVGHRVRRVSRDGMIHTVAGTGQKGYSGDGGPAKQAQLNSPYGVACDRQGNLYIADLGNARVRRVARDGTITTFGDVGLSAPRNIAIDSTGGVYFSDFNAHRVYRVDAAGGRSVIAGTGTVGYSGDGGFATAAQVAYPAGLAFDKDDNLYIADTQNHVIRRVTRGIITTFARAGTPTGLTIDLAGTLYAADVYGAQILRFTTFGAGSALGVAAHDVAFGSDGTLYVATGGPIVRKIAASGAVSTVAGGGSVLEPSAVVTSPVVTPPVVTPVDQNAKALQVDAVNAANHQAGPIAPGMLLEVRIAQLSSSEMATAQVFIGGIVAKTVTGDQQRLLVVAPQELPAPGTAELRVSTGSTVRGVIPVAVLEAAPVVFADSSGIIIAAGEDGSLITPAAPALRGSVATLYATGFGKVDRSAVAVQIGGYPAELLYAGPSPFAGADQVNFRVPSGYMPSGNLPVVLKADFVQSQPEAWLPVR